MPTLTTFRRDGSKQVTNCTDAIFRDNKNKKLHPDILKKKVYEIAKTIAGVGYFNHSFSHS